jgi:hypothetical protein
MVLATPALMLMHRAPRAPMPAARAMQLAVRDPLTAKIIRGLRYDRVTATPVDSQVERVSFFSGPRIVAEVAVRRDGMVWQGVDFTKRVVPYGDWLAYQPAVLLLLGALFVLLTGVTPLRRMRNLDVAAVISLVVPVVLLQYRYVSASVISAAPALIYLLIRLSSRVLGSAQPPASATATSLFDRFTSRLRAGQRVRLLRLVLGAVAVILIMVSVSSPDPVDVITAVMEGATKLVHGVLPYNHMPGDVLHGDTYPVLSYLLYTPLAAAAPVNSTWDNVDGALAIAAFVALAVAGGLFRAVAGRRVARPRPPEAEIAGLRAALVWLSFPPLLITASTGTTDVVLAAMLLFAVLLWRSPAASSGLLAMAAWFKLAPAALVPVWLAPLRGRRLLSAVASMAAVSAAMLGVLVAVGGIGGPEAMIRSVGYQFSRGSPQSVWSALGLAGVQPLAQAATLALIAAFALHLFLRPALALERERMAAAAGAVLIAAQLVTDYWAFLYLVWVVPLLALTLLGAPVAQTASDVATEKAPRIGSLVPVAAGK